MATDEFLWIGNHPATDLCNTEPVVDGERVELLPDVEAIARWARQAGVVRRVSAEARSDASTTVDFVHRLRAALRGVLEPEAAAPAAYDALNAALAAQGGAPAVTVVDGAPTPTWVAPSPAAQLRLDVATAVLEVFQHDRRRVRRCANPACVLLFLDESKSGRRRWCDMATCGNRAKAARHHERARSV